MPTVSMPDGTQVNFPDDMPGDQIRSMILQKFPNAAEQAAKGPGGFQGVAQGILNETTLGKLAKGAYESVKSAVTLPRDVMAGRVDPTSDEGIKRAYDMAFLGSPLSAGTRGGQAVAGGRSMVPQAPKVPSATELKATSGGQYDAARALDVTYAAPAVKQWAETLQAGLEGKIVPERAKETYAVLEGLQKPGEAKFATYDNLQSARDQLQDIARDFAAKGGEREAARRVRDALDKFIEGTHAPGAVAGPAAEAARLTAAGRGNRAAAERASDITGELDRAVTGVLERAEGQAAVANSGRNFDNIARARLLGLIKQPREVQGWSDAELAAAKQIYEGGFGKNVARNISNKLGGGGGIGQTVVAGGGAGFGGLLGGALGGPVGTGIGAAIGATTPTAIGSVARGLANRMTRKELEALDEQLRRRSPLFLERQANPAMIPADPTARALVLRGLLGGAANYE